MHDIVEIKNLIKAWLLTKKGSVKSHAYFDSWWSKRDLSFLKNEINLIVPGYKLSEQVYIILNHDGVVPVCEDCLVVLKDFKYIKQCLCDSCRKKKSIEKRKETNKQRYGGNAPLSDKMIYEKAIKTKLEKYGNVNNYEKLKKTNKERYGYEHHMQNDVIKKKVKQTNEERYGCANPLNSEEIQQKIKENMVEKYGCEHHMHREEVKEKIKHTNKERYGFENPFENKENIKASYQKRGFNNPQQDKDIREKTLKTVKEKYGSPYLTQNDVIKEKIKKTNKEKYGYEHHSQNKEIQEKRIESFKANYKENLYNQFNDHQLYLIENVDLLYKEHQDGVPLLLLAKKYDFSRSFLISLFLDNGYEPILYTKFSNGQRELYEDIKSITDNEVFFNCRSIIPPKEIDIFIPSHNLGIEYNGSYWHTVSNCDIDYKHLQKTKECKYANIQLLQFFDHEYQEKKEIVLSLISSKLGKNKRIFARKCNIKEVNNKEYKDFCEKNHLQGYKAAKIKLGLYHENVLVCVMSFSKPNYNKNYQYEIIRYVNQLNMNVVGGASKLLSHFKKIYNPYSIISYADARYSNGNLYKQLGMQYLRHTSPNYWYISNKGVESRLKYQKHKLPDLLEIFDSSMTEKQNMVNNGYRIINDCGNLVYVWSNS